MRPVKMYWVTGYGFKVCPRGKALRRASKKVRDECRRASSYAGYSRKSRRIRRSRRAAKRRY